MATKIKSPTYYLKVYLSLVAVAIVVLLIPYTVLVANKSQSGDKVEEASANHTFCALISGNIHVTLRQGMMNSKCVAHLQYSLNWHASVRPKLAVDGDFGPLTYRAVRQFQNAAGIDVDGIVGPQTWRKLHANCQGITCEYGY